MTKLVFSRHGESEANVRHVYWNQPGRFPLTAKDRQQAEDLAETLADCRFSALHCSPVLRSPSTDLQDSVLVAPVRQRLGELRLAHEILGVGPAEKRGVPHFGWVDGVKALQATRVTWPRTQAWAWAGAPAGAAPR